MFGLKSMLLLMLFVLIALPFPQVFGISETPYTPSKKVEEYHHYQMFGLKSMLLLLLFVLIALPFPQVFGISETPYTPSKKVEEYHHYQFSTQQSYIEDLAVRPVIVLIFGIIVTLLFIFWSCCRCCGCCGCKRPRYIKGESSNCWRTLYTLFALALLGGCVGMIIYGFKSDSSQSTAFNGVVDVIDLVIDWKTDTLNKIDTVLSNVQTVANDVTAIHQADPGYTIVSQNDIDTMTDATTEMTTNIGNIRNSINGLDVSSFRSSIGDKVKSSNDSRHTGLVIVLVVFLIVVVLSLYFALADSYCSTSCQPHRYCCCRAIVVLIGILTVVVIILAWLVSALLLAGSLGMADYCITPTTNTIASFKMTSDTAIYYLSCNEGGLTSPLQSYIDTIQTQLDAAQQKADDARTNIDNTGANCALQPPCPAVSALVDQLIADLNTLRDNIGRNGDSGVFGQVDCASINGKYQAFLNLFCGDAFTAVSSCFETFISFSCFIVAAEFIRRKLPVQSGNNVDQAPPPPYNSKTGKHSPMADYPLPQYNKGKEAGENNGVAESTVPPPLLMPGAGTLPEYEYNNGGGGGGGGGGGYPFHTGAPFVNTQPSPVPHTDSLA